MALQITPLLKSLSLQRRRARGGSSPDGDGGEGRRKERPSNGTQKTLASLPSCLVNRIVDPTARSIAESVAFVILSCSRSERAWGALHLSPSPLPTSVIHTDAV